MRYDWSDSYFGRAEYIITKNGEDVTQKFNDMTHTPFRDWVVCVVEREIAEAFDGDLEDIDWDVFYLDKQVEKFLVFDEAIDDPDYPHLEEVRFYEDARVEIDWYRIERKGDEKVESLIVVE